MLNIRTNQITATVGMVMWMLAADSASGQQPVIRGAIIIQQNGQERVLQLGPQGAFRTPSVPQRRSEVPVYPEAPPLPSRPPIDEERLNRLIAQLSSNVFRERVEATRELKTGGAETVRKLAEVIQSDSPEAARRAFSILEELFICEDEFANEATDEILSLLVAKEESPLAAKAEELLKEHAVVRTIRATRELELLGAQIEYRDDIFEIDDRTDELIPKIRWVRFDGKWKGGVQGLKQLSRIHSIGTDLSQLYYVLNCPVSREDFFAALKTWVPRVDPDKVNIRGTGVLGISFEDIPFSPNPGVVVKSIAPGGAAAEADIRESDVLIKINEIQLKTSDDLITELKKFAPGDEVEITLKRFSAPDDQNEMTKQVKLKGWDNEEE